MGAICKDGEYRQLRDSICELSTLQANVFLF